MVKHDQSPTPHQRPGKFKAKPAKGPSIEVIDFHDECNLKNLSAEKKYASKKSNAKSSEMLTTAELVSAVGHIWDRASHSLARPHPRAGATRSEVIVQKGNTVCYLVKDEDIVALSVRDSECLHRLHVQVDSRSHFPSIVQKSLECMRMTQKICYTPFEDYCIQNFLRENWYDSCAKNYTCLRENNPLENEEILSSSCATKNLDPCIDTSFNIKEQLSCARCTAIKNWNSVMPPLGSDYFLQVAQNSHHTASVSTALSMAMKSVANLSDSGYTKEADCQKSEVEDLAEDETPQSGELNIQCETLRSSSRVMNNAHPLLAKQEHAFSGALSGIVVSLCLHPVDTVKTVLQSCQAGPKSLFYIGQSVITERGFSGLYRGISSNIMTSAPISSLYTFTYESVKGFLLPSLAKEYHYVAHCTAGGCASIATSFVFTPSDHIKQQMQVNSKYQNCWNAALRIIEKGGLLSLYTGWGAVLCRNIPHSIIKFYTYETLKQKFVSSEMPNSQPSTWQTLLCGGLAGSAAALFSTPFDVVKTRLQTQIPGSPRKYQSILNALQQIQHNEGAKGLYRGLIPRLVMYMSQGALFFASYEFFKSLLSLVLCRDNSEMLEYTQDTDDDTLLPV